VRDLLRNITKPRSANTAYNQLVEASDLKSKITNCDQNSRFLNQRGLRTELNEKWRFNNLRFDKQISKIMNGSCRFEVWRKIRAFDFNL